MASISLIFDHKLDGAVALERIKGLLAKVKTDFADQISNLEEEWDGSTGRFSFTASGSKVSGTIAVRGTKVQFVGEISGFASLFKGKIERTIMERAQNLLA